jgi:serine protease inhibitor
MRGFARTRALLMSAALAVAACTGGGDDGGTEGAVWHPANPGDGDSDTGADADSDSDADTDLDTEEGIPSLAEVCAAAAPLSDVALAVVDAQNAFGAAFFQEVGARVAGGNFSVSPVSMHAVWSMLYNGAEGETAAQIRDAFAYGDLSVDELNDGYNELLGALDARDPDATLAMADSIWIRDWFEGLVEPGFIDVNAAHYDALIETLDFSSPDAADIMNAWVSEHTGGHIDGLVVPPISDDAVMYLMNALFFQSPWSYRFEPGDTIAAPFFTGDGGEATVQMMRADEVQLPFYQEADFQMVQLPYGNGVYAMSVIVPREDVALGDVREDIDADSWEVLTESTFVADLTLSLPRFEMEFSAIDGDSRELVEALESMGVHSAFGEGGWPAPDLTGISDDLPLYVSDVKHKTFVQVTEEGTEAAAASLIEISTVMDADADGPPHFDLTVDRPFLFAIHDRCSGSVLFLGQVTNPPPVSE